MVSVEFDPKVNAMYVRFKEGKVAESESLADNVIVDIDEKGEVVGIEVLLPKLDEKQREFVVRALKVKI
ncbi:DUF2283 domain-containing protein [Archaeoglobus sp.]|uniref:DUF2283 domain-containing protein n=1 Tax=Archaeoglobus sp. TaxID=1872626 RepID=UPI0024AA64EB|nr:DUF2283 domain-containing protein [Archaeoglobus sp.]MDI3497896.1 hypothetical protein [Archaeoglobus sp.]